MSQNENDIKINRGKCDSLDIYEVSEGEMSVLEKWSNDSLNLNFGIFLISTGLQAWFTLLTVEMVWKTYYTFLIICIIGFVNWFFLLIKWFHEKDKFSETIKVIKDRIKREETELPIVETEPDSTVPSNI